MLVIFLCHDSLVITLPCLRLVLMQHKKDAKSLLSLNWALFSNCVVEFVTVKAKWLNSLKISLLS